MLPAAVRDRTPPAHGVDLYLAGHELPYFAEYAAFCWGHADYESKGDCARPGDRQWRWLEVRSRGTDDRLLVFLSDGADPPAPPNFPHPLRVEATAASLVWQAAYLTMRRSPAIAYLRRRGHMVGFAALADQLLAGDDIDARWERTRALRAEFESDVLKPFDTTAWWGGWKWGGDFASAGSWTKRHLLHAVHTNDKTALPHLFDALAAGVPQAERAGWLHGLTALTGKSFASEAEWLSWWKRIRAEQ